MMLLFKWGRPGLETAQNLAPFGHWLQYHAPRAFLVDCDVFWPCFTPILRGFDGCLCTLLLPLECGGYEPKTA